MPKPLPRTGYRPQITDSKRLTGYCLVAPVFKSPNSQGCQNPSLSESREKPASKHVHAPPSTPPAFPLVLTAPETYQQASYASSRTPESTPASGLPTGFHPDPGRPAPPSVAAV